MQRQEGSLCIPSVLGPKSHPAQGNPTRAPNKGVWRLIYRQFFVSVTGVAGFIWLARQDERISYLFLVNVTQVLEPVVWSLTISTCILHHNGSINTYHKYLYINSLERVDYSLHKCEFHLDNDFSPNLMTSLNWAHVFLAESLAAKN